MERIEILADPSPAQKARWDALVLGSSFGTIFSTCRYLDALNVRYRIAVMCHGREWIGGAVLSRDPLGRQSNALYCKHLGPVICDNALRGAPAKRFAQEVRLLGEMARGLKGQRRGFSYRFSPRATYLAPFVWEGYRQESQYTSVIRAHGTQNWRASASKQLRYELRKAEQSTAQVRQIGSETNWSALHKVAMRPYTRRGAHAPLSQDHLEALYQALAPHDQASLWVVEDGGQITNVALCVNDAARTYFLINGSSDTAQTHANKALMAQVIDHSLSAGRDFDFEGSMLAHIARVYREFTPDFDTYAKVWQPGLLHSGHDLALKMARKLLRYG